MLAPGRPPLRLERTSSEDFTPEEMRRVSSGPLHPDRRRSLSWNKERPGPIDNRALLEAESEAEAPDGPRRLRRGLFEHLDFDIVPESVWRALHARYGGGPALSRRAVRLPSAEVQVELYGLRLRACRSDDMKTTVPVEMSRASSVRDLRARLRELLAVDGDAEVRLWLHGETFSEVLDEAEDATLEKCRILEDQLVSLEVVADDIGSSPPTPRLDEAPEAEECAELQPLFGQVSEPDAEDAAGLGGAQRERWAATAGLRNLGNTCFMNSSIQCLSNIPCLSEYFLSNAFKDALEKGGHKTESTSGELAEGFAELLDRLWMGRPRVIAPWDFKSLVEKYAEQFSGYRQHDSMEFIEYVIDGLKEDTNFVKGKKPYVERKDADGRPDSEVALEAANNFLLRNDSIVDDLFVSFQKQVTTCPEPECKNESVIFEALLSVKVPLMSHKLSSETTFAVTVVPLASSRTPVRPYRVSVNKFGTVGDLVEAAAQEAALRADHCVLLELYSGRVYKFFEAEDRLEDIGSSDVLLLYELEDADAFQMSAERRWGSGEGLQVGDVVVVTQAFMSNSERHHPLELDLHGKVVQVDGDGDARVKFDDIDTPQWVFAKNFSNLKTDRNMDSEERRTDPDDGKAYTLRELVQAFDDEYSLKDLKAYWRDAMKPLPGEGEPPISRCGAIVHFRHFSSAGLSGMRRELLGIPSVFCTRRDTSAAGLVEAVRAELVERFGASAGSGWTLYKAGQLWEVAKTDTPVLEGPQEEPSEGGEEAEGAAPKDEVLWLRQREYLVVEFEGEVPREIASVTAEAEAEEGAEGGEVSLDSCLEWATEMERLTENDSWYCNRCKEHREAFKKIDFWSLPPVLVLQLKRFENISRRLNTPVRFPLEGLDMRRFVLSSQGGPFPEGSCVRAGAKVAIRGLESAEGRKLNDLKGTAMYLDAASGRFCVRLREGDEPAAWKRVKPENLRPLPVDEPREAPAPVYDLVGVSKQTGTLNFGHYIAYARSSQDGHWRIFDDDDVRQVDPWQVESEKSGAYVLFYLRRDHRPEAWGAPASPKSPC